MATQTPTIVVIIGISGDLSKRKLLPAIGEIARNLSLPEQFRVVGVTRRADVSVDDLLHATKNDSYVREHTELFQMDITEKSEYARLAEHLQQIEDSFGAPAQRLFYLSVAPSVAKPIIALLGTSGLASTGQTKLLLEKPFGINVVDATDLVKHIDMHFAPEQVYRIDHYLAKETAQNILTFREGNSLFKRTWSNAFIEKIEIIASESISIEGRASFYEQTGALRDFQSHLLQLAAFVLMELPDTDALDDVPKRRLAALQQLAVPEDMQVEQYATRGQYRGYREEVQNPESITETFMAICLRSSDPAWRGVPINIVSGKSLYRKATEINISYKQEKAHESNVLSIILQPNEGIEFCIWTKNPGYEHSVSRHSLGFSYADYYDTLPEAYEQVLFNAIQSDHKLFTLGEEMLESWRIVSPVQEAWAASADDLVFYEPGTPAIDIIHKD